MLQCNIFDNDVLVIPYFWKGNNHFVCVVVEFRTQTIAVYDSLYAKRRTTSLYNVSPQKARAS